MANTKESLANSRYRESYHGFHFEYPHQRITKPTTETILDGIVSTTTEIVNNINNQINQIFAITNDTQNASNTTDNILTSNNDVLNNTLVDVNVGSNATATENNITAVIPDIFGTNDNSTEAGIGNTLVETLSTTTENFMNYITNKDFDIITSTGKIDTNMTAEHDMHTGDKTAYIIITVLVIILFLIGLGLFVIYMYYKKKNTANISAQYHSRGSREIASSERNQNDTVVVHQQAC